MQLEGIHHITAITADGQANLDFYVGVMGLRMVKKTVNQDDPSIYHLFYADEQGDAGSDLTFFEFPGAPRGRPGAGMVSQIDWRLGSTEAVAFWGERLTARGIETTVDDDAVGFDDPEGLRHRLTVVDTGDEPLIADHPEIPAELALRGFDGVRAQAAEPGASAGLLEGLGFDGSEGGAGSAWEARGERRGGHYRIDAVPPGRGLAGAGTVHHVAWASRLDDHQAWRARVIEAGASPTPVIDRHYFRSIYFREPNGVLFEIATLGPGFTVDEPLETLGESLSLPPDYEHLRDRVEAELTPLRNPRLVRD